MFDENPDNVGVHICPECGDRFDTLDEKVEHARTAHGLSPDGTGWR